MTSLQSLIHPDKTHETVVREAYTLKQVWREDKYEWGWFALGDESGEPVGRWYGTGDAARLGFWEVRK